MLKTRKSCCHLGISKALQFAFMSTDIDYLFPKALFWGGGGGGLQKELGFPFVYVI